MNKSTLIAIFVLLNIAFASNHGFMNKRATISHSSEPTALAQLEEISNNDFGRKILDTIALQVKNRSPIGDIARMLAEIRQDLILQEEEEADTLHAAQEVECEEEITEFGRRIDAAQVARDDAQTEIQLLQGEIAVLQNDIASKAQQLQIIDARDLALREQREQDAFNFAARQAALQEVLDAIDLILEKLGGMSPDSSNEAVLAQLNKLGRSNPIMALAQLASNFNAESFRKIIEKLEALRDSLESTYSENESEEERSIQEFEQTVGELAVTRKNIATAKAESEGQLAQNEGALALQENILDEAVEELASSLAGKANKEEVCAEWAATWARNKEVRTNELNLIGQVQNIIATKFDTAESFLQKRIE